MKLAAYLRVSTDRQAEQGFGLDTQEKAIRAWARANGHRVVGWYRDEGISGSNGIESRLALHDALTAIKDGTAAGLVIYKLDRLARKLEVQEGTLARIWDMGADVFAVDYGEIKRDDPDDPMRTAIRKVIGVFAELERGMIAARMRAGRATKHAEGGWSYGRPPFGWMAGEVVRGGKREPGLVADATEQATLARMRELRAAGQSYRAIAETLNAEGRRPKQGTTWHPKSVREIVLRPDPDLN